jgi:hypothetical protein
MTRALRLSLLLLSAATLVFEINLTRLFSVAQFYHFAFMIVSLALLGYGASGTALAIFPRLVQKEPQRSLGRLALGAGLAMLGAYGLTNWLPFDSYSLLVDRWQVWILALHFVALATPFFFGGMAVSLLLAGFPRSIGQTYALNLLGSALGCAFALGAPAWLGGEGTVVLSSGMAALAAVACLDLRQLNKFSRLPGRLAPVALLAAAALDCGLRLGGGQGLPGLELHLSPYKGLSYALQNPQAELISQRWNAFSRVDVVRSPGIHSLPGLSYRYPQLLPAQDGLMVDGDDLSAILPANASTEFAGYLPAAIAFQLRPEAEALALEPRGGLDITLALASGARQVTAVEVNPLIVAAAGVYQAPGVQVVIEADRSYLRRAVEHYDIVLLSLANAYHPVGSGAYSLAEDYRYTVEGFQDALARLNPGGILVVTRWLQDPPSEDLRAFALAVTAVERAGGDPARQIVALRGYNTTTLLVRNGPFTDSELDALRAFTAQRAFDLTYAPGIRPDETNHYNVLPEPIYYQTYLGLLEAQPRQSFYKAYPFDVSPPTDDHPFFGHYFKWSQAGQAWAALGRTWQPFGGAGYFVILALLLLAIVLAGGTILLPVVLRRSNGDLRAVFRPALLGYYGWIGFAFLLVEIPLIQKFILYLGQPAYAMTTVIFALLLFSALGSRLSRRLPLRLALGTLALLLLSAPVWLQATLDFTLGLPLAYRLWLSLVLLAPVGFLMGVPFPGGTYHLLRPEAPAAQIAWAWAVNGAASVIAAVLAALLALTFGFNGVLWGGAGCYLAALLTAGKAAPSPRSRGR